MVKLMLYNGRKFSIRPKLKRNLDLCLNDVKNNKMDLVLIIDGPEGWAKSFTARQIGVYCATVLKSTFDVNDITFNLDDYINQSLDAGRPEQNKGKFKINCLDEGRKVANKRRAMSREVVQFTNFLSECRALQQVHIICLPAFHDLDSYIVLWRMKFLIHLQTNYIKDDKSDTGVNMRRGVYKLFTSKRALQFAYMNKYNYPRQYEEYGQMSNRDAFTPEQVKAYEEKKNQATIDKYYTQKEIDETPPEKMKKGYVRSSEVARELGLNKTTVTAWLKDGKVKGGKINNLWFVDKNDLERKLNGQNGTNPNTSGNVDRRGLV